MRGRNQARSSSGTPTISPTTVTGIGKASSAITSASPRAASRSSRSSTMAATRGWRADMAGGMNAPLAAPRSRVCSGGLAVSIEVRRRRWARRTRSGSTPWRGTTNWSFLPIRASPRIWRQASKPETYQFPSSPLRWTGAAAWSRR